MKNTQIISVINQKGGVGKTTTVINLGTALSFHNKKVLIIDLDPQGNATTGLGLSNNDQTQTIYDVLNGNLNFEDSIKDTKINNLKLVSSNVDLSGLEVETASQSRRAFLLKDKLENFINNPKNDLPDEIFLFLSRISPLINVDLLIKNKNNEKQIDGTIPTSLLIFIPFSNVITP